MKLWHAGLVGLALGLLLCWLVKGDPSQREQAWLDSLNVERERSAVLARADSASQRRVDSLLAVIGTISVDTAAQRRLREANTRAAQSALLARRALDSVRTASDSLRLVFVALGASEAHRDTLQQEVGVLRGNLEATGRMLALTRQVVGEITAQRDSAQAESGRLRVLLHDAMEIIEAGPSRGQRIGRAAETGMIGVATVKACEASLGSIGCIAGALVTAKRLL